MASFQKSETLRAAVTIALLSVGIASMLNFLKLMPGQSRQPSIYKLIYTVPPSHLAATKQAIFAAGGGTYDNGKYKNTTFESPGLGVFTPDGNANPNIGQVGIEEKVEEIRVEVRCEGRIIARRSVEALLLAHPYETVGYEVFKTESSLMSIDKSDLLKQQSEKRP